MSEPAHSELDLATTLRPGLDILADEIVIALKKRSRFVQNRSIYRPGLVRASTDTTLLDYSLHEVEKLHAALGRYTFATQEAFTDIDAVPLAIVRQAPESPVLQTRTGIAREVRDYYLDWVDRVCLPGEDSASFGETVTSDVVALHAVMERINLGKPVAEVKYREHERAIHDSRGDRDLLLELIRHPPRETAVLQLAERLAERYELDPDPVRDFFTFMIETTVEVEINYLRQRIGL